MLRIRLRRVGRKNDPHYQIVVAPHTNAVKSSVTANVGWYNPKTKQINLDKEQLLKWLNEGAQPSNTVAKILIANKIEHKLIKFVPDAPGKAKKKAKTKVKAAPKADETAPEVTDEAVVSIEATPEADTDKTEAPAEAAAETDTPKETENADAPTATADEEVK